MNFSLIWAIPRSNPWYPSIRRKMNCLTKRPVELATQWTTVRANPVDQVTTIGQSYIRLKRWSDDIYWNVIQANVAGW
jgi:hypothetical protein